MQWFLIEALNHRLTVTFRFDKCRLKFINDLLSQTLIILIMIKSSYYLLKPSMLICFHFQLALVLNK